MPRPEEKPPFKKRVDELVSEITVYYWNRYSGSPCKTSHEIQKRDANMINSLIKDLATERAKNEIPSK